MAGGGREIEVMIEPWGTAAVEVRLEADRRHWRQDKWVIEEGNTGKTFASSQLDRTDSILRNTWLTLRHTANFDAITSQL